MKIASGIGKDKTICIILVVINCYLERGNK